MSGDDTPAVKIGTRGSPLARWQAEWVAGRLREMGVTVDLVFLRTQGDIQAGPIGSLGAQGVFTKEIQRALLEHEVDLAVHSLKDLPTEPTDGLELGAVPVRESCGDCLISINSNSIDELPEGARLGTGSARRRAQLLAYRPDLQFVEIRGNVDTRLKKLAEGQADGLILAEAGLRRLELTDHIRQRLPLSIILPAIGQGALGIEIRSRDSSARDIVSRLNDPASRQAVLAERALLRRLRGGCLAPVGAWGRVEDEQLRLDATVLSPDGRTRFDAQVVGVVAEAESLGIQAADQLLAQGADRVLQAVRP